MICAFLDENGRLFSHRILSRDECLNATSKKDNLKALFPDDCGDSMVCIIDDREDVWNHATNLIQVKPYHFFQHTGDINAPPGLAKHELDGKGVDFNKIVKLQKVKDKKKATDDRKTSSEADEKPPLENDEKPGPEADEKPAPEGDEKPTPEADKKPTPEADEKSSPEADEKPSKEADEKAETDDKMDESEEKVEEPTTSTSEVDGAEKKKEEPEDTKEDSVEKKLKDEDQEEHLVEIQDPDDYLLYLESILKLIHQRFYETYEESKEIPDLKSLIPKLKSEVLVGVSIVFSGLVPNIVKLEHSRPYLIAKNLGAEITEGISEATTHLVAASTGTQKVFQAQKNKKIHIVTPDWLWTCSERWEHVDEMLFPLNTNRPQKMRQIPAHCSPDRVPEPDDVKFNNPYLQMSDTDIASMEAEVEDSTTSESEGDAGPPEAERPPRKKKRNNEPEEEVEVKIPTVDLTGKTEDDDILSISSDSGASGKSSDEEEDEEESPSAKFRRGETRWCSPGQLDFNFFFLSQAKKFHQNLRLIQMTALTVWNNLEMKTMMENGI